MLNINLSYRPIRIGFCIPDGDFESMREVQQMANVLWGGKFNPIIPINAESIKEGSLARDIVEVFKVDALWPMRKNQEINAFIDAYPYLPWPSYREELFFKGRGESSTFADIHHPVSHLVDESRYERALSAMSFTKLNWQADDPLADVMLSIFGTYPAPDSGFMDYGAFVKTHLPVQDVDITPATKIDRSLLKPFTPRRISEYGCYWLRRGRDEDGIYVGSVNNFADLIHFWNLRATTIQLVFYDPVHHERLGGLRDAFIEEFNKAVKADDDAWPRHLAVWTANEDIKLDVTPFGKNYFRPSADRAWGHASLHAPTIKIGDASVLASVEERNGTVSATFALPNRPYVDEPRLNMQDGVLTVESISGYYDEEKTFNFPCIPELNEFYGRNAYIGEYRSTRSEPEGMSVLKGISRDDMHVYALGIKEILTELFKINGIKASPSSAGIVGRRLIQQMGGIESCRIFKIPGVRRLIRKYGPNKAFHRGNAMEEISKDFVAKDMHYFVPWAHRDNDERLIKPLDVFASLVDSGVFRMGHELHCPHCELDFWLPLDEVGERATCYYCGRQFQASAALCRDEKASYRRSGIFGLDTHQSGNIPVAVTLQQLHLNFHSRDLKYVTGMNLEPITADIFSCESDFIAFCGRDDGKEDFLLAECKDIGGEITDNDVRNLAKVADALPADRLNVYILFSKLGYFTPQEIERCKKAQRKYQNRVILLGARELEPLHIAEKIPKSWKIDTYAGSLKDLANLTARTYFDQRHLLMAKILQLRSQKLQ